MHNRIFQSHSEMLVQAIIFIGLVVYFTALFQAGLPGKLEFFALVASSIFAIVSFTTLIAINDYFTRLNNRLLLTVRAIERHLIDHDKIERIQEAIDQAESMSNYYSSPSIQWIVLTFFSLEILVSIALGSFISKHLGF